LIGALYSLNTQTSVTFDVPLRDSGPPRASTGAYSIRIDGDYTTVVAISNTTDQPGDFTMHINYDGGPYVTGIIHIAPGATKTYDIRKLRDEQKPDVNGHPLPIDLKIAQVRWSVRGTVRLNGRAEVVSIKDRVSSSYSCFSCCADSFSWGWIEANGSTTVAPGATVGFTAWEQDGNTGGQSCPSNPPPYPVNGSWDSSDGSVATVDSFGNATAISAGYGGISCYWPVTIWMWDDLDESCEAFQETAEASDSMTVLQITLQKGDGSSLPSPLRVGVTANNHDRKQQLRAVVDPATEAANVTISVSSKLTSSDVSTSNGVITFKVVGTMESESEGDQTITATHNTGMKTTNSVTVAIPKQIGTPHPTFNGTVTGVNFKASRTSVPPYPEVPEGKVQLLTIYGTTLNVLVWDKWMHPIGDLYSGANIVEIIGPLELDIGVTLTSSSAYPDRVGNSISRDFPFNFNYDPDDPIAKTWLADSPKPMLAGASATQNISVKVDGFALSPAVANRTVTTTPPNTLVITWP
jgi:hypothetical protein